MKKKWKYDGILILEGILFDIIAAVNPAGNCPFWDEYFLPLIMKINEGTAEESDVLALTKLREYFKKFADHGRWNNEEQLKHLKGTDFFEFKAKKTHRVFFYYDEKNRNVVILTHHIVKKGDTTPKKEIERMNAIKKAFDDRRTSR